MLPPFRRSLPLLIATLCALLADSLLAQQVIPLISTNTPEKGWTFGNGSEFPGATGSLTVDHRVTLRGRESLKLVGDFTQGGGYVQAGKPIDRVDIRELSLWLRHPDATQLTLRLNDASGQTHQIVVKLEESDDWQQVVLPLERFFARRGQADAVTSVARYESWGGAKDGKWHGPATALYILVSKRGASSVRTLWLTDVSIVLRPLPVTGVSRRTILRLDDFETGADDWKFSNGAEFKGATGSMNVVRSPQTPAYLNLSGDFAAGGAYVAAIRNLGEIPASDTSEVRLRMKSANATSYGIQLVDASGQTHQRRDMPLSADDQWHDVVIRPSEIAGGEHWGGSNDGKWHGPLRQLVISLTSRSDKVNKHPELQLSDIRAEVLQPVFAQPAAFKDDFEPTATPASASWELSNGVIIDSQNSFQGTQAMALMRTLEQVEQPRAATSPQFGLVPGHWQIRLACRAELHSPDNSYHAAVQLECLDADGKVVERFTIAERFGKHDWQQVAKTVEVPPGAVTARLHAQLNKTYGRFWLDDISASYLAPAPQRDDRIERLLFSTAQLGNLLFPEDSRRVGMTVETRKPLRKDQQQVVCVVQDYWGAEQMRPRTVSLGAAEKKGSQFVYRADLDLSDVPLETGRYYEVHAQISSSDDEPFRNHTSLAILPEAENRKHAPELVPFTARNWDNRISEYIRLTDRLGVRICGLWGGWSSKPPYKPEAPGLELAQQLGMGWLTTTPIKFIEQGKTDYDEQALRQGMRNFLEKYGHTRPIINLGNEPHGTGQRVLDNVAAYRAVYEEVKRFDPTLTVVATSVEPNEEYFQAGYGKWCDAYDFHIYESHPNVRRTIGEYRALAEKYGVPKPIWSTELGLNSQGMPRREVACELIKKFSTFFAAGGVNVSWFGLLYPDAEAKSHGSSGDSHNVFDCRYNRYAPRLDAIAYYHAVNGIGVKKFVDERQYADGVNAFLFCDTAHHALQVLWKDKGRQDLLVPLPEVGQVQLIRLDGACRTLHANARGLTLTVTEEPLLLLYETTSNSLPEALDAPVATWQTPRDSIDRAGETTLNIVARGISAEGIELKAPPLWTVKKSPVAQNNNGEPTARFVVAPPAQTLIREVKCVATLRDANGHAVGELYYRPLIKP